MKKTIGITLISFFLAAACFSQDTIVKFQKDMMPYAIMIGIDTLHSGMVNMVIMDSVGSVAALIRGDTLMLYDSDAALMTLVKRFMQLSEDYTNKGEVLDAYEAVLDLLDPKCYDLKNEALTKAMRTLIFARNKYTE